MIETVQKILEANGGLIAVTIGCMIGLQIVLGVVKATLDKVKDVTETKWDNKAAEVVGLVLGIVSKCLSLVKK